MKRFATVLAGFAVLAAAGCAEREAASSAPAPPPLVAGIGEEIAAGTGGVPCGRDGAESRRLAERAALRNAVERAATAYGDPSLLTLEEVVTAHRVERYWQGEGRCFAAVQAVVRTDVLGRLGRRQTKEQLAAVGRPKIAFAVQSYRILPNIAVTTRRAAAEVIDSLQEELIRRGFDVRRTLAGRREALQGGGEQVADISSAERAEIARRALADGVFFLVQGEIKVTDEGKQGDGQFLAVVDGSLEAVDLRTEDVVAAFRDVSTAKFVSASAAYTKAISAYARSAADELAPQMLDSWRSELGFDGAVAWKP
jgi:hypothetical protein